MLIAIASIAAGYLLGSVPAAYLVARYKKGIDIREVDIGNMGAGSTIRQVGIGWGILVAIVDVGKGALAVWLAMELGASYPVVLATGLGALLGHCFPFAIGFRGGQGVATIIGVFLVLAFQPMLVMLGIMAIALAVTRHLYSMILVIAPFLPVVLWLCGTEPLLIAYSLIIIVFIIFRTRHRLPDFRLLAKIKH